MYIASVFLIASLALTILAFARHPVYGVYLYLAMTYVYPQGRWWGSMLGDIRWSFLAGCIAIAATLLHFGKLRDKPLWLANVPAMALLAYCAWMWIQVPWALDPEMHLDGSWLFLKSLIAFWFVYRVADTPDRVRDLVLANVIGCGLLGIIALFAGREGDRLDGVGGPGMDSANTLGMYFATAAILAAGLVLTQRGWRRWLSLACGAAIMEGLILKNTRGAVLGLDAGALVLFLTRARQHRRAFLVLALVGVAGMATLVDQKFMDRMTTIGSAVTEADDIDDSALSRIEIVRAQLEMFGNYPLGAGYRGTAVLSPQYLGREWLSIDAVSGEGARSSHNTFMTALVEQGLPGAVIFTIWTVWILRMVWRLRATRNEPDEPDLRMLAGAIGGALVVIFAAGNTADFLLVEIQFWLLALFVSALQMLPEPLPRTAATPTAGRAEVQRSSV